jgi:transposase
VILNIQSSQDIQTVKTALEQLSKPELIQIILELYQTTTKLYQQNKELTQRVEELENQLKKANRDSNTSSKPPAQDIQKQNQNKNKNQSLRQKSGKQPGGQKGHQGKTRNQVDNPDKVVRYEPEYCTSCGQSLKNQLGAIKSKRQERDIPPIKVFVTEHQKIEKQCTCGCRNQGTYPEHIKAQIQIGSNAQALLTYLNVAQLIPFQRLTQLAKDLFGFSVSEGSIDNILNRAEFKAQPLYKLIMNIVKEGNWVGSDETGTRVAGHRDWLWVWQSALASYYAVSSSRGYQVPAKHFGEDYAGILIHDCWSAQNNTRAAKGHQQCHPHLQRFLQFLIKDYRSSWAYQLNHLLYKSQQAQQQIWQEDFDSKIRKRVIKDYEQRLQVLIDQSLSQKDSIRLQKRFRKHQQSIFRFLLDPTLPFHNNDSEKAIRNAKVKQKISGGFRSCKGADRHAVLLSIVETAKKQGLNLFDSIKALFTNQLVFQGC